MSFNFYDVSGSTEERVVLVRMFEFHIFVQRNVKTQTMGRYKVDK